MSKINRHVEDTPPFHEQKSHTFALPQELLVGYHRQPFKRRYPKVFCPHGSLVCPCWLGDEDTTYVTEDSNTSDGVGKAAV
ncbi:uncharacterized protein ARMOST_16553 [Armillaria ostoyae]|uniref:Uncharacterized protein n=1 Tax=Armillaria ostoyae TaxID=47428 RepID=A0A284RWI0_ARMOS|nr:uncharacterized protein ARMOST_16553 [Armillaria ostoyae]